MTDKVSDTLVVSRNGQQVPILMSYALLTELTKVIKDITDVQVIMLDQELRDSVLKIIFAERTEDGLIKSEPTMAQLGMTPGDVMRVLRWASEHALDFFLEGIEASVAILKPREDRLKNLMPSGAGSPA